MSKQAPGGSLEGGLPPVRLPSPVMHAASPVNGPTPRRTMTTWNILRGVGVALASANDICACGDARMHHFPYAVLTGNLQGLSTWLPSAETPLIARLTVEAPKTTNDIELAARLGLPWCDPGRTVPPRTLGESKRASPERRRHIGVSCQQLQMIPNFS